MFERVCETNLEPKVVAVRLVRYIQYIKNIKEYCGKQQYDHVDLGEIYWIIGGVLRDMDGKEKFARQVIDSNDQTKVDLLIEIAKSMNDTVGNLEKLRMFQSLSWTSK